MNNPNYYIARQRLDPTRHHIDWLEVYPNTTSSFAGTWWKREQVVSSIERGYAFMTMYSQNGKWVQGEHVRVTTVNGQKFLRTDENHIAADNLGNLPEG